MKDLFMQGSILFHYLLFDSEMFSFLEIQPLHFFSFLRVFQNKIIVQVLDTFSKLISLFWILLLNMELWILRRPKLKQDKISCWKNNWSEINFHWFRFFPCLQVIKNKKQSIYFDIVVVNIFFTISSQFFIFGLSFLFFMIEYVLLYMQTEFLICLWLHSIYQGKLSLENLHLIGVDLLTKHYLFYLATIGTIIFPLSIKRRLCWTLLLAWMFQLLQDLRKFIHTANLLGGWRLNNSQSRQSLLHNSKDFPDRLLLSVGL